MLLVLSTSDLKPEFRGDDVTTPTFSHMSDAAQFVAQSCDEVILIDHRTGSSVVLKSRDW